MHKPSYHEEEKGFLRAKPPQKIDNQGKGETRVHVTLFESLDSAMSKTRWSPIPLLSPL